MHRLSGGLFVRLGALERWRLGRGLPWGSAARRLAASARRLPGDLTVGRFSWAPFAAVLAFFFSLQVRWHGWSAGEWDVLVLTGWAWAVVGVVAAQGIPPRMRHTLRRLADREALVAGSVGIEEAIARLDRRASRWAVGTGLVLAAAMLAAFIAAFSPVGRGQNALTALSVAGAFLAGLHLGRMVLFGRVGKFLAEHGFALEVTPGHVDGAGGLKPVGDFYFFQAMVVAVPAIHLSIWTAVIPLYGDRYTHWRDPYIGLLVVAVLLEVFAFVAPMLSFHRGMEGRKREFQQEADKLSVDIAAWEAEVTAGDHDDPQALLRRIEGAKQRYAAIEQMPTWPVDLSVRRRFRINNLALLLPLAGRAFGATDVWKQLSDFLRQSA